MKIVLTNLKVQLSGFLLLVAGAALFCLFAGDCSLLTADQQGYRLFSQQEYERAATHFADPMWQGAALFRQGEFEKAATLFAGYDTAEGAFNQGNALVMQGLYEVAIKRFERALQLRPGWDDAEVNRDIASARAQALTKEGGNMTDGKPGADEIVFEQGKAPSSAGEEQVKGGEKLDDAALRSIWLRQIQTKPADFLRAKFAAQYAARERR